MEVKLKEAMKTYRKLLQKIVRTKTKVLSALKDEGVRQAEDLLLTPAKEAGATRCQQCVGCVTLNTVGPCCVCPDCRMKEECTEHTRLCLTWRQPTTTYVAGSEVTGVSSICAIAEYDLKRYRDLLDSLGDASLEVEAVLDDFPSGAEQHRNDRYNATRRTRDIQYEEEQFVVIENLVNRYQEERVRLVDVESDGEDDVDDAVDVGSLPRGPSLASEIELGSLTNTQTHFIAPFLTQGATIRVEPPDETSDDLGLGLGTQSPPEASLVSQVLEYPLETSILEARDKVTEGEQPAGSISIPATAVTKETAEIIPAAATIRPDTKMPTTVSTPTVPLPVSQPRTSSSPSVEVAVSPPRKEPVQIPHATLVSLSTTTVTTSSTRATPAHSVSADAVASVSSLGRSERRRSSSEGLKSSGVTSATEESDQLFRARQLVASRSKNLAQNLDTMLARARSTEGGEIRWIQDEITRCQRDMDPSRGLGEHYMDHHREVRRQGSPSQEDGQMEGVVRETNGENTASQVYILGRKPAPPLAWARRAIQKLPTIGRPCGEGQASHVLREAGGFFGISRTISRAVSGGALHPHTRNGAIETQTPA